MKKTALVLCSALALTVSAQAGLSYNNLAVDYIWTDLDEPASADGSGVGVTLEFSPIDHLYFTGSAAWSQLDNEWGDTDHTSASLGVGGFWNVTESVSLAGDVGVIWNDVDVPADFDGSDTAIYVRPHVRLMLSELIEFRVGATFDNLYGENNWGAFGAFYLEIFGNLDLSVGAKVSDEGTQVTGGVRVRF